MTEGKARKALERRYQPERGGRATPGYPCRYESYTRSLCSPSLCTTSPAHPRAAPCYFSLYRSYTVEDELDAAEEQLK